MEYLISIRVVGYTLIEDALIEDALIAEVHESVADEVGAWCLTEDVDDPWSSDVFMKKPRVGTYYKYIELKNIVHEES